MLPQPRISTGLRQKSGIRLRPVHDGLATVRERVEQLALGVEDIQFHREFAIQPVRGAGEARVIGADGHLHRVQHALVVLAIVDQAFGRLCDRHIDGRVVVRGTDDQVDLGEHALGVGLIVVDQRAPRRFRASHSPRRARCYFDAGLGTRDLGVMQQPDGIFSVIQQLDQAGPVIQQRELRGPAELPPELFELRLRQRRIDEVANIDARQGVGAVTPPACQDPSRSGPQFLA